MRRDFRDFDDRELLLAASSDRDAFAEIYRRHVYGVLGYFHRAVRRSDVAFDLTAETFAAALIALPDYRATAAPGRSWLYAIAHNRLVDSLRRGAVEARAREQLGMQAIALSDDGEAQIERIVANLVGQSALELVKSLPDEQRDAVTARFLEDRDYAEIAAEMSCSEQVVRKRVSRGLAALRGQLGADR
jgi:RNA polymerase sigma factor (sigma-70 family)